MTPLLPVDRLRRAFAGLAVGWRIGIAVGILVALGAVYLLVHTGSETRLGALKFYNPPFPGIVSSDGRHLAYIESDNPDERFGVVVRVNQDGRAGPRFNGIDKTSLTFSPSGKRVAYAATLWPIKPDGSRGDRRFVVVDGRAQADFDEVDPNLAFSYDSKHLTYRARRGARWSVVADGTPGPEFDDISPCCLTVFSNGSARFSYTIFSRDGKHFAYVARRGGKWLAVLDGRAGPTFDGIGELGFSEDGTRMAYSARNGGRSFMVVDGRVGGEFEVVLAWQFINKGNHMEYVARTGGRLVVVDDDRVVAAHDFKYDDIRNGAAVQASRAGSGDVILSPDGKHVAFGASRNGKWFVVVDGREGAPYDDVRVPMFSPDGRHVAYAAKRGVKQLVVVDGRESEEQDGIVERRTRTLPFVVFSPDSSHVLYVARRGPKSFVVLDGHAGAEYDEIDEGKASCQMWNYSDVSVACQLFSADSKRIAYRARRGEKWLVVIDGKEYDEGEVSDVLSALRMYGDDGPNHVIFSPDSKHVAYLTRNDGGKWSVVVDGTKGPEYDGIGSDGPIFSPDSRDLAYVAFSGHKPVVVENRNQGIAYDRMFGAPSFSPGGSLEYLAVKDKTIYRVRARP